MKKILSASMAIVLAHTSALCLSSGQAWANDNAAPVKAGQADARSKLHPKPLSDNVKKGLEYLVQQQNDDGSWSQGEESQYMRSSGYKNGDVHNIADTCMAAMAVVRSGSLPNKGPYKLNLEKAVLYVCDSIEKRIKIRFI